MPDNKNERGGQDRSRVAGGEDYEVNYLAEKMNVSADKVREAIKKVGNSREKLEAHLRGNSSRS